MRVVNLPVGREGLGYSLFGIHRENKTVIEVVSRNFIIIALSTCGPKFNDILIGVG